MLFPRRSLLAANKTYPTSHFKIDLNSFSADLGIAIPGARLVTLSRMPEVNSDNFTHRAPPEVWFSPMTIAATVALTYCVRHIRNCFDKKLSVGHHRVTLIGQTLFLNPFERPQVYDLWMRTLSQYMMGKKKRRSPHRE